MAPRPVAYPGARGSTAAARARVLRLPAVPLVALEAGLQARSRRCAVRTARADVTASDQEWADPTLTSRPAT